ncbi:MAG: hypothetical protein QXW97_01505 [Candidatus Pacearchaeota archaeon]
MEEYNVCDTRLYRDIKGNYYIIGRPVNLKDCVEIQNELKEDEKAILLTSELCKKFGLFFEHVSKTVGRTRIIRFDDITKDTRNLSDILSDTFKIPEKPKKTLNLDFPI